ncbi:MAG: hypothetical protein E7213_00320 [Clostridium sp.]|jgi:hypothetical protein|nr:hypothetical protein [Clostridium sp.]
MVIECINKTLGRIRKKQLLDDTIEIRINSKEKVLFQKYAELQGLKLEDLIKTLVRDDIDKFIKG